MIKSLGDIETSRKALGYDMVCQFEDALLVVRVYSIEHLPPDYHADNPTDYYGGDYLEYDVLDVYVPTGYDWERIITPEAVSTFAAMYESDIDKCIIDTVKMDVESYKCPEDDGVAYYH